MQLLQVDQQHPSTLPGSACSTAATQLLLLLLRTPGPGQPEVTDFEVARGIEEQVAGLEVTVQDVGCVHVLEAPQHLSAQQETAAGSAAYGAAGMSSSIARAAQKNKNTGWGDTAPPTCI